MDATWTGGCDGDGSAATDLLVDDSSPVPAFEPPLAAASHELLPAVIPFVSEDELVATGLLVLLLLLLVVVALLPVVVDDDDGEEFCCCCCIFSRLVFV